MQGYTNFGKPHSYLDKMRQNSPSVTSGLNPNIQNMIPNLQNLNPNMQSSPNLTHTGQNAPNLSLNFQNLSPIVNSQSSTSNPTTPQVSESEFHRLNSQMTMASNQYNGNLQVNNVSHVKMYYANYNWYNLIKNKFYFTLNVDRFQSMKYLQEIKLLKICYYKNCNQKFHQLDQ